MFDFDRLTSSVKEWMLFLLDNSRPIKPVTLIGGLLYVVLAMLLWILGVLMGVGLLVPYLLITAGVWGFILLWRLFKRLWLLEAVWPV